MKTLLIIFTFTSFFMQSLNAQINEEWAKRHLQGVDPKEMRVDNNGNVYVTGKSLVSNELFNFFTVKYSSSGAELWARSYNGPVNGSDEPVDLIVDNNGNVYVLGRSAGTSGMQMCIVKYNSAGDQQWVIRRSETGNCLGFDNSGNLYVGGNNGLPPAQNVLIVIKFNQSGNEIWTGKWDYPAVPLADNASKIILDNNGNIYAAGFSYKMENGSGVSCYLLVKFSPSGDTLWSHKYNGTAFGDDYINSIALDNNNNIYITGKTIDTSASGGTTGATTIKYTSGGGVTWIKTYKGNGSSGSYAWGESVSVNNNGEVFVAGTSRSLNPNSDMCLIKYNSSGNLEWLKEYNGSYNNNDFGIECRADNYGSCYITGTTYESGTSALDFTTIKYNNAGVQTWLIRYNGGANYSDQPVALERDNIGNVYVFGLSNNAYLTVKYSDATGVSNISAEMPDNYYLSQNYPNPFNPVSKIRFQISKSSFTKLTVFDETGKEVKSLVNENLNPGTYETEFNGSNNTSGVYFYRLETAEYVMTKKMMLVK